MRSRLNFTACAVTGAPDENLGPRRNRKVQVTPSFAALHDSASPGSTASVASSRTSVSATCLSSVLLARSVMNPPSSETTSVPSAQVSVRSCAAAPATQSRSARTADARARIT